MTNYSGQFEELEESTPQKGTAKVNERNIIEWPAYRLLRAAAEANPDSVQARFLIDAYGKGFTVEVPTHGTQVLGYDEIVGVMWKDSSFEDPLHQALANLMATSLSLDLVGDGR